MRFFKAGNSPRTPEDEVAAMRLTAIANRLKPQDSDCIQIDPIAAEPAPDPEPDTLQ
jgi:hypothetical protein